MIDSDFDNPKCSDYFIIKLRFYASDHYMRLMRKGNRNGYIKHMLASRNYYTFFWKFIEKVTDKKYEYFSNNYFLHEVESSIEEIRETHDIYHSQTSKGYHTFFIPRKYKDIVNWVKASVNIPNTILDKSSIRIVKLKPNTHIREGYKTNK